MQRSVQDPNAKRAMWQTVDLPPVKGEGTSAVAKPSPFVRLQQVWVVLKQVALTLLVVKDPGFTDIG